MPDSIETYLKSLTGSSVPVAGFILPIRRPETTVFDRDGQSIVRAYLMIHARSMVIEEVYHELGGTTSLVFREIEEKDEPAELYMQPCRSVFLQFIEDEGDGFPRLILRENGKVILDASANFWTSIPW